MAAGHLSENHPMDFRRVNVTHLQNAIYTRPFDQILCYVPSRCVSYESRAVRVFRLLVRLAEVRL